MMTLLYDFNYQSSVVKTFHPKIMFQITYLSKLLYVALVRDKIRILLVYCSMGGSPGDVSEESVT